MTLTRQNILPTLIFGLLICCSARFNAFAQEVNSDLESDDGVNPSIEWVKSWPSNDKKNNTRSFKDHLNAILFGKRTPVLSNPVSVLATNPQEFWILDQGNNAMFQVRKEVGDIPHPIMKTSYDLSSLVALCAGPNSGILFTDSHAGKVYSYSSKEKKLRVLNDTLTLEQPTGIAYDSVRKEVWIVETRAHRIAVINEKGELIKRIGSRGIEPGEFNYPTHIWIDRQSNVYITDAMNFRIQVLNAEGEVISVFGEAGDATGYFARPKGIATDSFGNIYIVDAMFHVVQIFDIKGNFLYRFGSQGHGNGEFWMPTGIYIDHQDNIYVADSYNSRVQVFKLSRKEPK